MSLTIEFTTLDYLGPPFVLLTRSIKMFFSLFNRWVATNFGRQNGPKITDLSLKLFSLLIRFGFFAILSAETTHRLKAAATTKLKLKAVFVAIFSQVFALGKLNQKLKKFWSNYELCIIIRQQLDRHEGMRCDVNEPLLKVHINGTSKGRSPLGYSKSEVKMWHASLVLSCIYSRILGMVPSSEQKVNAG